MCVIDKCCTISGGQLRHSNLKTFEVSGKCFGQDTRIPEGQAQDDLNTGEDCVDDLGKFQGY